MAGYQFLTRFRFFLVHMYKEEEAWLEEMSRRGWHLVNVMFGIRYTFIKGESIAYKYSLDYRKDCEFDSDYIQLFNDAGWQYIGKFLRWRYFRTLNDSNMIDMFNDNSAIIERNNHLIFIISLLAGLNLAVFLMNFFGSDINGGVALLNLGVVLLLSYVITRLRNMNNELK